MPNYRSLFGSEQLRTFDIRPNLKFHTEEEDQQNQIFSTGAL